MAAVRQVKPLKYLYSEFPVCLLNFILSNGSRSKSTDVVFDVYETNSIKMSKEIGVLETNSACKNS